MRHAPWAAAGAFVAAIAAIVVGMAPAALAHTTLASSQPGDRATVSTAPESVELVFSESLTGTGPITVTGPAGAVVSKGPPAQDGPRVVQALDALPGPGVYTVAYEVLAGDGHPLTGQISFTSTAPAPAAPARTATGTGSGTGTGTGTGTTEAAAAADPEVTAAGQENADDEGDEDTDVSSVIIGGAIVVVLLAAVVLVFLRLRSGRRG